MTKYKMNNNSELDYGDDKHYLHEDNNNVSNEEGCSVSSNGRDTYHQQDVSILEAIS